MSSDAPLIELSISRRWAVLALIVLGSTIYNAMVLIASTLLPQMQGALSATADEVAWVDQNLEGFKGRVTRDEWVAQAKLLAEGGETEFSKRVDKGGVYDEKK